MKILWLGCGDIGNRFGKYVHDSHQCFGVRRQIANVQPPLISIFADILDRENMHSVMSNNFDVVIVTLTPDEYSPSGYWTTYFEGASSIKYALDNAVKKPKLVIWVSSTRVYRHSNEARASKGFKVYVASDGGVYSSKSKAESAGFAGEQTQKEHGKKVKEQKKAMPKTSVRQDNVAGPSRVASVKSEAASSK